MALRLGVGIFSNIHDDGRCETQSQNWSVEFEKTLLRFSVPPQDDANGWASFSGRAQRSFTELCMLHTLHGPY